MIAQAENFKITGTAKLQRVSLIVGVAGIVLSLIGAFIDARVFYFSWLTSAIYWVTLGLGGLFLVMLHHLIGATWSVVFRRLNETVMMTLPVMAIMFIPVLIGIPQVYEWAGHGSHNDTHHARAISIIPEAIAEDTHAEDGLDKHAVSDKHGDAHGDDHDAHAELLAKKTGYLNLPFFVIRTIIYFLVWSLLAFVLYNTSRKQDSEGFTLKGQKTMRTLSAPGMILFALTVSFAGFDWMMSLNPLWYSTIYGVYFFSGCVVAVIAFLSIFIIRSQKHGVLTEAISVEHRHAIGKLLFAFVIFWAYMALSQYLLIWYANIPEETIWYHQRWEGGWKFVSLLIVLGHFTVPFIILMGRGAKRNVGTLLLFAVWMLVMHWVDLYWNIQPTLYPEGATISWMDFTTMAGIGGIFFYFFWKRLSSLSILPVNDPKLEESMRWVN